MIDRNAPSRMPPLSDRLSKAEGPRKRLFEEVWDAIHGPVDWLARSEFMPPTAERFQRLLIVEAWTEAAMSLVPEGYTAQVRKFASGRGLAEIWDHETISGSTTLLSAEASTPAIALCIAALEAVDAGRE